MTKKTVLTLGLAALAALPASAKIGLSTQFVDVEFEGLQPGGSYNLRELNGVPYTVRNRGDAPAEVLVDAQIPPADRVDAPYEPIPDASWVELNPGRLRIDPGSLGFADVIVRIPDDPRLKGRHFQATVWARTVGTGKFAAAVNSRLRFSVGAGPQTQAKRALEAAVVTLNYDLWPNAIYVQKAPVGERYDAKEVEKKAFMLTNRADAGLELVPEAVPWPTAALPLPAGGWEAIQDLSWVRFEPETVSVDPLTVRELRLVIDRAPQSLRGRKAAFLIRLKLPNGMVVNQTHRGFVTFTAPEAPEKK